MSLQLKPKDSQLGSPNDNEHAELLFQCRYFLTPYNFFYFNPFIKKFMILLWFFFHT